MSRSTNGVLINERNIMRAIACVVALFLFGTSVQGATVITIGDPNPRDDEQLDDNRILAGDSPSEMFLSSESLEAAAFRGDVLLEATQDIIFVNTVALFESTITLIAIDSIEIESLIIISTLSRLVISTPQLTGHGQILYNYELGEIEAPVMLNFFDLMSIDGSPSGAKRISDFFFVGGVPEGVDVDLSFLDVDGTVTFSPVPIPLGGSIFFGLGGLAMLSGLGVLSRRRWTNARSV